MIITKSSSATPNQDDGFSGVEGFSTKVEGDSCGKFNSIQIQNCATDSGNTGVTVASNLPEGEKATPAT